MQYLMAKSVLCIVLMLFVIQVTAQDKEVTDNDNVQEDPNKDADRRDSQPEKITGFSASQKQSILKKHNDFRRKQKASNMRKMIWDDKLSDYAQKYASKCNFQHSSGPDRKNIGGFLKIGENLWASTGADKIKDSSVINTWYDEISSYTLKDNSCESGKACGHYTQVVWSNTSSVGCGVILCPYLAGTGWDNGYYVVCSYGPVGNYVGKKPFATGTPCSACPDDAKVCDDGLCAPK